MPERWVDGDEVGVLQLVLVHRVLPDTTLRLSRFFGTTDRVWLNLQTRFDLETEKHELGSALDEGRPLQST